MSAYLIEQIRVIPNISIRNYTELVSASGTDHLTHLTLRDNRTDTTETVPADTLFVFIGARPFTDWLPAEVLKSPQGLVLTGRAAQLDTAFPQCWSLPRPPYLLGTSVPGIFAEGDVRAGAMARVAAATGEGATAISFVHRSQPRCRRRPRANFHAVCQGTTRPSCPNKHLLKSKMREQATTCSLIFLFF